jgi:hypothetical protein
LALAFNFRIRGIFSNKMAINGLGGIVEEDLGRLVSSPKIKTTINPIVKFFSKMNTYCIKTPDSEETVKTKSCYMGYNEHSIAFSQDEGKSYRIMLGGNIKLYKVVNDKRRQLN